MVSPNVSTLQSQDSTSPQLRTTNSAATSNKIYDIDSLQEINKANDLATKKIEITNHIFEMLVLEVKESLFPVRDEEDEEGSAKKETSGS